MVDYVRLASTAERLVKKNGRVATIARLSDAPPDPTYPWEGSDLSPQPLAEQHDLPAVFVPPSSATQLGMDAVPAELLARFEQVAIVAPGPSFSVDLKGFQVVVDGGMRWRVEWVSQLRPATQIMVYFFGVRR